VIAGPDHRREDAGALASEDRGDGLHSTSLLPVIRHAPC
jgi:hypothetical protein